MTLFFHQILEITCKINSSFVWFFAYYINRLSRNSNITYIDQWPEQICELAKLTCDNLSNNDIHVQKLPIQLCNFRKLKGPLSPECHTEMRPSGARPLKMSRSLPCPMRPPNVGVEFHLIRKTIVCVSVGFANNAFVFVSILDEVN